MPRRAGPAERRSDAARLPRPRQGQASSIATTPAPTCRASAAPIRRRTAARPIATATASSMTTTRARTCRACADADPEKNGCPPDRDGDGDHRRRRRLPRRCPASASDDPAKNGCPPDRDGDTIIDRRRRLPRRARPAQRRSRRRTAARSRASRTIEIKITERIEFEFDSAKLVPSSEPVLERGARDPARSIPRSSTCWSRATPTTSASPTTTRS